MPKLSALVYVELHETAPYVFASKQIFTRLHDVAQAIRKVSLNRSFPANTVSAIVGALIKRVNVGNVFKRAALNAPLPVRFALCIAAGASCRPPLTRFHGAPHGLQSAFDSRLGIGNETQENAEACAMQVAVCNAHGAHIHG